MHIAAFVFLSIVTMHSHAYCFDQASKRFDVPVRLLQAIAEVETGMNVAAINTNKDGSEDIGLMQINSTWLPVLKRHGIERKDLWDGCTNVMVGAWILAQNIATYGYTWEAVGAYNARSAEKRERYAKRVFGKVRKGGERG